MDPLQKRKEKDEGVVVPSKGKIWHWGGGPEHPSIKRRAPVKTISRGKKDELPVSIGGRGGKNAYKSKKF